MFRVYAPADNLSEALQMVGLNPADGTDGASG